MFIILCDTLVIAATIYRSSKYDCEHMQSLFGFNTKLHCWAPEEYCQRVSQESIAREYRQKVREHRQKMTLESVARESRQRVSP